MANPTCILVLGVPRSGTSCVAGVLHHLGISMGERLIPTDEWNPAGYFQDEDFEDILHEVLGEWFFPRWTTSKPDLSGKYARQIMELAAKRAANGKPWGVKSNRLIHFLNALIAGAGPDLRVILTQRPLEDSIASWTAHSGYPDGHEFNPIRRMSQAIVKGTAQLGVSPDLIVELHTLQNEPEKVVQQIADVCGRPVTREAVEFVHEVNEACRLNRLRRFTNV